MGGMVGGNERCLGRPILLGRVYSRTDSDVVKGSGLDRSSSTPKEPLVRRSSEGETRT